MKGSEQRFWNKGSKLTSLICFDLKETAMQLVYIRNLGSSTVPWINSGKVLKVSI